MTAVRIRGLTMTYGATRVLHGVNLDIPAGSLTAVLGPSGCGKTTLLRLVAGFLRPDAGEIRVGGRTVEVDRGRRGPVVGYVPQEGALFPHLSVAENVLFGLPRRQRRQRSGLADLLALVDLDPDVADRYPGQLSGGQQQRVALARALAVRPGLVLLDEPFSSLDAGLREETATAVAAALRRSGATGILVTHDQSEALSLADQVAVLRDGEVAQVGSPSQVYRTPVDRHVATFVGSALVLPGTAIGQQVTCALGLLHLRGTVPADGEVDVVLRPEQLLLGDDGVPATVVQVSYYGHDAAVQLVLTESALPVSCRIFGSFVPTVGDHVRVSVQEPVLALARQTVSRPVVV